MLGLKSMSKLACLRNGLQKIDGIHGMGVTSVNNIKRGAVLARPRRSSDVPVKWPSLTRRVGMNDAVPDRSDCA
jgi:hypothetical protein